MSVLLSSTNRPPGGGSDGCAACGGKHVKHTCGKAKPPTCKRRRAQERELEFENPGRQNLRGFCEGCEDKRRKLSAQAKAAEEMKHKIARQDKQIRGLLRERREERAEEFTKKVDLRVKIETLERAVRRGKCFACAGWNIMFPYVPLAHTCVVPSPAPSPPSSLPSSPGTSLGSESVLSQSQEEELLPSSDDDLDDELSSDEVSVGELSADELTEEESSDEKVSSDEESSDEEVSNEDGEQETPTTACDILDMLG